MAATFTRCRLRWRHDLEVAARRVLGVLVGAKALRPAADRLAQNVPLVPRQAVLHLVAPLQAVLVGRAVSADAQVADVLLI